MIFELNTNNLENLIAILKLEKSLKEWQCQNIPCDICPICIDNICLRIFFKKFQRDYVKLSI